jgi:L-ascorbate metabolism protein UlaG (beta-lactamase superfamily)
MLNISGYKILTDPVYENKISFFGPSRFNGNIPLNFEQLPEIDVVVISHNHYDHLNKYSIKLLNEKTKMFVVPLAVGVELERWGIPREKISELDWWDEINIDENLMIAAAPAQHFSGRRINDNGKTLWASFVIRTKNHKVYFSGDSGYFDGFKKISEKYGPFDITFIECGAYNDKWHHIHMYPEETVQAHIDLRGEILHPIHWATFNLSLHPWFEPMERLSDAAEKAGIKITTPIVGGTTVYNMNLQSDKWWEEYLLGDAEFIMEN